MHTQHHNRLRPKIKPQNSNKNPNFTNRKIKIIKDYIWDCEPVLIADEL